LIQEELAGQNNLVNDVAPQPLQTTHSAMAIDLELQINAGLDARPAHFTSPIQRIVRASELITKARKIVQEHMHIEFTMNSRDIDGNMAVDPL
jgi:hypothetical protein